MAFTRLEPTGVNTSATFTFANANVTTNLNVSGESNLGPVGNVTITGGSSGQVLSTDGSGTLSWVAQTGGGTDYSNANVASYLPTFTGQLSAGNLNVTGNITSAYFIGNGSQLTGLPASYSNTNVAAYLPTYTGNFTAGNISVTGNTTSAYFIGNGSSLSSLNASNITTGTIPSSVLGNSTVYVGTTSIVLNRSSGSQSLTGVNIDGSAATAGTVTTAAQPNITSLGTLVDANISGNLFVGGNLTVNGTTEYTNVTNLYVKDPIIEMGGNANAGALTSNDNKDRGSLLHYYTTKAVDAFMGWDNSAGEFAFGSNVSMVDEVATFNSYGNLHAGYFIGNGSQLTGLPATYANANVAAYLPTYTGNVSANYFIGNGSALSNINASNVDGQVASALIAGTVTTNAQPNITSVGSLSGLTVSNSTGVVNFITTANVSLGSVANLKITGGSASQYLQTDGTGNLIWATVSTGAVSTISNGTSNVNIATSGGNVTTSVNGNADVFVVTGTGANVNGYLNVTDSLTAGGGTGGSISGANSISANYFVGDGSLLSNINAGNLVGSISGANSISANYFVGNGSLLSNVNASNLISGTISSTILGNSAVFVGTTSIALNRTSGAQSLTGITSIDGYAATVSGATQGNITSIGTLSSLTVSGLVTATAGGIKVGNIQDTTGTNTIQLLNSNVSVTGNLSVGAGGTGNVTATYFIGNGSQLTGISAGSTYSNANVATYLPTYTGNFTAGNANISGAFTTTSLTVSGATTLAETTEVVAVPTGTTYDYLLGSVFYVNQPGANFTPNFTNVPTTDNRISVITLIINQSATPGMPTAMQIGGTAQTIKWPSGTIPTGVASSIQTVAFAFLRYGAAWIVTGSSGAYL